MTLENTQAFEAHQELPNVVCGTWLYSRLGGSGSTLGLIIAVLIFSKVQAERTVEGISIAPGLFEINEPIVFGIPIVMNPVYMLPFIVGPTVLAGLSYVLMDINLIERIALSVPWVTPPVLLAFLATGGGVKAAIFQAITLVLLTLLWTPFVMMSNKQNA